MAFSHAGLSQYQRSGLMLASCAPDRAATWVVVSEPRPSVASCALVSTCRWVASSPAIEAAASWPMPVAVMAANDAAGRAFSHAGAIQ